MGALHQGHGALIEASVAECDVTVVSIYVNPLQFGPAEDFHKYPRDLEADEAFCRERGVDLVFAPADEEMYPRPPRSVVDVTELTKGLCGAFRPGHFRGVTTVVAKLFHIVMPDIAYFGQKDYQQVTVIRRMVEDLDFPLVIRSVPTVREADGLAMVRATVPQCGGARGGDCALPGAGGGARGPRKGRAGRGPRAGAGPRGARQGALGPGAVRRGG